MSDSWSSLRSLLRERFPYPIAWAFEQYNGCREDSLKLGHILYAAESLLQFVGSVVILDAFEDRRQAGNVQARQMLRELPDVLDKADLQAPGIGLWQYAIERLLPKLQSSSLPELFQLVQNKPEWEAFCQNLDSLKNERNGLSHPWRRISDGTMHRLLPQLEHLYFQLAASLRFLADYRLVLVVRIREKGSAHTAVLRVLTGERLTSEELEVQIKTTTQTEDLVLLGVAGSATGRALILNPLYRIHGALRDKRLNLYAYQRPLKNGLSYYCVDDPDEILSLKDVGSISAELKEAPRAFRRRELGLSQEDLSKVEESVPRLPDATRPPPSGPGTWGSNSRPDGEPPRKPSEVIPPVPVVAPASLPEPPRELMPVEDPPEPVRPLLSNPIVPISLPPPRRKRRRALMVVGTLAIGVGAVYLALPHIAINPSRGSTDLSDGVVARDAGSPVDLNTDAMARDVAPTDLALPIVEKPWTVRTSGTTQQLFGVWGDDARLRVAVGEQGTILVSEDAGAVWQARSVSGVPPALLHAVTSSSKGTLLAVGRFGTIVRSSDRGKTWIGRRGHPTGQTLTGIYSDGDQRLYVVGDRGTMLRSDDDGETWSQLEMPVATLLRGIWGRGANDLYAAGWDGIIVHSVDGLRFQRVQSQTMAWLWGGYSDASGGVFVVGKEGRVLRSLDRGKSFRPVVTGYPTALTSIWGNDRGDVWITGQAGIFHSSDRGATWTPEKGGALADTNKKLNQIWGAVSGELLAVGYGGLIVQRHLPPTSGTETRTMDSGTR